MNALFNNNTGTCQCVCQNPNLGDTGDNLSDIVKNSLQYLIETKFVLCIYIPSSGYVFMCNYINIFIQSPNLVSIKFCKEFLTISDKLSPVSPRFGFWQMH